MHHCISVYIKYHHNISAACKALGYKNPTQLKKKLHHWGALKDRNDEAIIR
jgi:hypothetical protein